MSDDKELHMVRVPYEYAFNPTAKWKASRFVFAEMKYDPTQMGDREDDI
jgi:hypothetical protein